MVTLTERQTLMCAAHVHLASVAVHTQAHRMRSPYIFIKRFAFFLLKHKRTSDSHPFNPLPQRRQHHPSVHCGKLVFVGVLPVFVCSAQQRICLCTPHIWLRVGISASFCTITTQQLPPHQRQQQEAQRETGQ